MQRIARVSGKQGDARPAARLDVENEATLPARGAEAIVCGAVMFSPSNSVTWPVAELASSVADTVPVPYSRTDGAASVREAEALAPAPASVWMTPAASIWRIRPLAESVNVARPAGESVTASGVSSVASVARPPSTREALHAGSGDCGQSAAAVHVQKLLQRLVGKQQRAGRIDGQTERQARRGSDRGNQAGDVVDTADAMLMRVGDEHIAHRREGKPGWRIERRCKGRTTIAGRSLYAASGNAGNAPRLRGRRGAPDG